MLLNKFNKLRDAAHFHLLRLLAKASRPLPCCMTPCFARCAAKRVPNRVTTPKKMLIEIASRFNPIQDRPGTANGEIFFSILLPVYNADPHLLRRCLDTVLNQTWAKWELCVVDDASSSAEVPSILHEYEKEDTRIRVIVLDTNRGIAGATQVALEAANGSHIALLDHDDELTFDALERMATAIAEQPAAGVFYSDECKLSPDGQPVEIFAKPDWSPAMMINCMYMGHLSVYRRDLVIQAGGFRSEFDFSQDYDLALRMTETGTAVIHVPEVLYGWRMIPQSAVAGGKSFARETNIAALQAAAERRGWKARAVPGLFANELHWDESERPHLSIVIPSDNAKMIEEAVWSIINCSTYDQYEILVVTNSRLITELESKFSAKLRFVPYDLPFNFSDKCNIGAEAALGDMLVFFNDDVRVRTREWMERVIDGFRMEGVGAVGVKLLYENNTIQHAGMVTGVRRLVGTAFHTWADTSADYFNFAQSLREVSLLCGALIAVRSDIFSQMRGFDAFNTPVYHADVDLCFKIREAGMSCLYSPHATLIHLDHVSVDAEEEKKLRPDKAGVWMLKRWPKEIARDPYFPKMMRDLYFYGSPEPYTIFPGVRAKRTKGDALLVSHDLTASGAPRVVLEMARALLADGWFVVVAAPSDGSIRAEFEELGVTVIIEPLLFSDHPSVRDLAKDYDLVVCNTVVSWPLVAQLSGIVPVALYVHEIELLQQLAEHQPGFKSAFAKFENVWVGSKICGDNARRYRESVTVLEYGLEGHTKPIRPRKGRPTRLAVFASFEPRKGQDLLAEAFASLSSDERKDVSLDFFGRVLDVEMRLAVAARFSSVEGLHFGAELSYEAYLAEIANVDMVIVPSRSDTLPLVSLNALESGIPLMCTTQTGTAVYLSHGVSGYIIPDATVTDMATALRRALAERDHWEKIGAAGARVFARNFSQEAFRARLLSMVNKVKDDAVTVSA